MRIAAYDMCGEVTATTAPADPAFTRAWPVTLAGGLAKLAGRHPREHYPGARAAD